MIKSNSWLSRDGLFVLLFLLSVIKVFDGPFGKRFLGGAGWLLVVSLLAWQIWQKKTWFRERSSEAWIWFNKHRVEVVCCILLVGSVFISCLINFDWKQQHWPLSALLMVSALVTYSYVFLSYWLFRSRPGSSVYGLVLILMIVVHIIPLWQTWNYDSTRLVLGYTLSMDMRYRNIINISSVLSIMTIYGPFAAVCAIYFWGRVFAMQSHGWYRYGEGLVAVLATIGALLCGSRGGLVSLFSGLLVLFWFIPRGRRWWLPGLLLASVISLHGFIIWNPYVGRKVGQVLPYVNRIRQHESIELKDFVPRIKATLSRKGSRWKHFKKAVELSWESPWFGIGLGQFNILSSFGWKHTVHNLYFNILCEGGIFVFIPWIVLVYRYCKQWRSSYMMAVVVTIAVASCFENLFTSSFAWILTCSWIFAHASQKQPDGRFASATKSC